VKGGWLAWLPHTLEKTKIVKCRLTWQEESKEDVINSKNKEFKPGLKKPFSKAQPSGFFLGFIGFFGQAGKNR